MYRHLGEALQHAEFLDKLWGISSVVPTGRKKKKRWAQTGTQKFPLNIRKHLFNVKGTSLSQVARRGCRVSSLEIFQTAWTWSWATCSGWICLSRNLDQMSPGVLANLNCSVISSLKVNILVLSISTGKCIFLFLQKVLLMLAKKAKEEVNTVLWTRTSVLLECATLSWGLHLHEK